MEQYRLLQTYFSRVSISRASEVPDPLAIPMQIDAQVAIEQNRFTVLFSTKSQAETESPVNIDVQVVGVFGAVDLNAVTLEITDVTDFLHSKGFLVLWPYVDQMIRQVTGLMGMKPIESSLPDDLLVRPMLPVSN